MNNWIRVKDRLPEYGMDERQDPEQYPRVLAFNGHKIYICYYQIDKKIWSIGETSTIDILLRPTHWMPLPENPTDE
jgi:hypothetical protein